MENLAKIEEGRLDEVVSNQGLAIEEGEQIKQSFQPLIEQLAAIYEEAGKINFENPTTLDEKIARELRLRTVKIRTGAAKVKDDRKKIHLLKANVEQAAYNLIAADCSLKEEVFNQVEKAREIAEKKAKEERKATREATLTALNFDFTYTDLLNMPGLQFDEFVLKIETDISAKIEADRLAEEQRVELERKAESERIEKERLQKEENERIRVENERLRKEAEEREEQLRKEREEREKQLAKERKEAEEKRLEAEKIAQYERELIEEKARKEREELEDKNRAAEELARKEREKQAEILRKEREERERIEREVAAKKEEEARIAKAEQLAKKKAAAAPDKDKLTALVASIKALEMPVMATNEAVAILVSVEELMGKVCAFIEQKRDLL